MSRGRLLAALAGTLLVAAAALVSNAWFDPLPSEVIAAPDATGAWLFRGAVALDGLLLLAAALAGWRYARLDERARAPLPAVREDERTGGRGALLVLLAVCALAAFLRLWKLGTDLWLDELATLQVYGPATPLQVWTSYVGSNNHLLNTLLIKVLGAGFGYGEAVVRLPAALFGIATVPLLARFGRRVASARVGIAAALLLAVSYQHVFFSQNARGYTAYLFFALLSTLLFARALRDDRAASWAGYVASVGAGLASLLLSAFVVAAHGLVGLGFVLARRRRGGPVLPLLRRLTGVFALVGLVGLHLYAPIVPQVLAYEQAEYTKASVGYAPFSAELFRTLIAGLSSGLRPEVLVAVLAVGLPLGLLGLVRLVRRAPAATLGVLLGPVLQLGYVVARGLSISPRLFLLCLPVGILVAVAGLDAAAELLARRVPGARGAFALAVAAAALLSASSLRYYYRYPKQDWRGALAHVESLREPDGLVVVVHLAELGFRHYGEQLGVAQDRDYVYTRDPASFDAAVASRPPERVFLVTTLTRILEIEQPEIAERIASDWEVERVFPGTLGDGDVTVWRRARR